MLLAYVRGTVTGTRSEDRLKGAAYLLVEEWSSKKDKTGKYHIAADLMGAGEGELVMLSQGSSARQTESTRNTAVDAVIVGIVDLVEGEQGFLYRK